MSRPPRGRTRSPPYIVAQVAGAILAAAILYLNLIARGAPNFDAAHGFAANGYGEHSPGQYSLLSAFVTEAVLTMMFVFIICADGRITSK